jgi:hypothetical protein
MEASCRPDGGVRLTRPRAPPANNALKTLDGALDKLGRPSVQCQELRKHIARLAPGAVVPCETAVDAGTARARATARRCAVAFKLTRSASWSPWVARDVQKGRILTEDDGPEGGAEWALNFLSEVAPHHHEFISRLSAYFGCAIPSHSNYPHTVISP